MNFPAGQALSNPCAPAGLFKTFQESDKLRKERFCRDYDRVVTSKAVRAYERFVKNDLKRVTRPRGALVMLNPCLAGQYQNGQVSILVITKVDTSPF